MQVSVPKRSQFNLSQFNLSFRSAAEARQLGYEIGVIVAISPATDYDVQVGNRAYPWRGLQACDLEAALRLGDEVVIAFLHANRQLPVILCLAPWRTSGVTMVQPPPASLLALIQWARVGRTEDGGRSTGETAHVWSPEALGTRPLTFPNGFGPVGCPRLAAGWAWWLQRRTGVWSLVQGHPILSNPGAGPEYQVQGQFPTSPFSGSVGPVNLWLESQPNGTEAGPLNAYTTWVTVPSGENPLVHSPSSWLTPCYLTKFAVGGALQWKVGLPGIPLGTGWLAHGYRWQPVATWFTATPLASSRWINVRLCQIRESTGVLVRTINLVIEAAGIPWNADVFDSSAGIPSPGEGGVRGQNYDTDLPSLGKVQDGGHFREWCVVRANDRDTNSETRFFPIWSYANLVPVWKVTSQGATLDPATLRGWTSYPSRYTLYTSILAHAGTLLHHYEEFRFQEANDILLIGGRLAQFTLWERGVRGSGVEATPTWSSIALFRFRFKDDEVESTEELLFDETLAWLLGLDASDKFTTTSTTRLPRAHVHGWRTLPLRAGEATPAAAEHEVATKTSGVGWRTPPLTIELFKAPEVPPATDPNSVAAEWGTVGGGGYRRPLESGESILFQIEYCLYQVATSAGGTWQWFHDCNSHLPNTTGGLADEKTFSNLKGGPHAALLRRRFYTIRLTTQTAGTTFDESYTVPWHTCNAASDGSRIAFGPRLSLPLPWPDASEAPAGDASLRPNARPFAFFDSELNLISDHADEAWDEFLAGSESIDGDTTTTVGFSGADYPLSSVVMLGQDGQALVAVRGAKTTTISTEVLIPDPEGGDPFIDYIEEVETEEQLQLWSQRPGHDSSNSVVVNPAIGGLGHPWCDLMAVEPGHIRDGLEKHDRALVVTADADEVLSIILPAET